MKRMILVVFCAVAALVCSAQNNRVVIGTVFKADGTPLGSAVLKAVGTELTFTSKADGTFQIQVPYYVKMIEASVEGYLTEQVEIDGSYMVFKLKVDKKYLENKAKAEVAARYAAQKAAEEKAKAEEEARKAAEEKVRAEALAKAKAEAAARYAVQKAAEEKAKAEEEARKEAEKKARAEAVAKAKAEEAARYAAQKAAEAKEKARIAAIEKAKSDSLAKVKAEKMEKRQAIMNKYNQQYRNKGLVHNLELNYSYPLTGVNTIVYQNYGIREFSTLHPVEFNYSIGYRFCNWVSLSIGAGLTYDLVDLRNYGDKFSSAYEQQSHPEDIQQILNYSNMSVPVFLNAKFYLSRGKVQPMMSLSGGVYLPLPNISVQDMLLLDAGLGCNFRLSKRSNMYVMASIGTVPAVPADVYNVLRQEYFWARRSAVFAPRVKIGFTL